MQVEIDEGASAVDPKLSEALAALGNPVRLALLRQLRLPRALSEIRVSVRGEDGSPERLLARQTVKEHLDRLVQVGFVVTREAERGYGATVEYVLNHQTVFAASEELRELAKLRPEAEVAAATRPGGSAARQPGVAEGPSLVLVRGLGEGRLFDVTPPPTGRREWVIGRRRGLPVTLDFDPYVSTENAIVLWEDGVHFVQDVAESRNGTTLNFEPLPRGTRRALRTGDLIGVGRTLLMFRA